MITPENACAFREWMFKEFKIQVNFMCDGKGNITSLHYVYGMRWNKDPKYANYSIINEITDKTVYIIFFTFVELVHQYIVLLYFELKHIQL